MSLLCCFLRFCLGKAGDSPELCDAHRAWTPLCRRHLITDLTRFSEIRLRALTWGRSWRKLSGVDPRTLTPTLSLTHRVLNWVSARRILAERAEAKQERDFETADALQAKLNEMGVTVDDRKRTWEAAEGGIAGYVLKGDAPPGLDMDAARAIFAKRAEAKRARDFDTADVFQAELRQMGIYVDDRKKTWEQAVNPDAPYTLQGRPPAGVDVEEVNARLAARRDAKKNKDFALADEIQDELLAKGVRIFDSKRAWGAIRVEPKAFELKGAAPEGVDVAVVEAMLAKRVDAKKVKDWATSDELQGELLKMGVYVNDKTRTWEEARWVKADGKKPPRPAVEAAAPAAAAGESASD